MLPDLMPGIMSGFFLAATMSLDDFVITYFIKRILCGLHGLSLLAIESFRYVDDDVHVHIAVGVSAQIFDALFADAKHRSVLRSFRYVDLRRTVQRRYGNFGAERCLHDGDGIFEANVVTFAYEKRMRRNLENKDQVAIVSALSERKNFNRAGVFANKLATLIRVPLSQSDGFISFVFASKHNPCSPPT